jgi:disulfide oxidoreductase YuzD
MANIAIKDAHDFIRSIIKKNKGGFVSPGDIDIAINRGVSDWMNAALYKYQRTGKFDYDHLLVKKKIYTVSSSTSIQSIAQDDYVQALTIFIKDGTNSPKEGTIYDWDRFLEIKNSAILAPNTQYPAATVFVQEESSVNVPKIEFAPVPASGTTYEYTLVYMRRPKKGVYAYTTSGGNFTYTSTGSVDIDIDERYFSDITTRALMYLGISLKDADVASTEAMKDNNQKVDER